MNNQNQISSPCELHGRKPTCEASYSRSECECKRIERSETKPLGFVIWTPQLDYTIGGVVVLHNLAKELTTMLEPNIHVMLFTHNGTRYENPFCNKFAQLADVNENTIVIYPEIVYGNPLNAKHIVRWLLCDITVTSNPNVYKSWNKEDLVFHYSNFKQKYNSDRINIMYTLWLNPEIKNTNKPRKQTCYMIRKGNKFHRNINLIHPSNCICLDNQPIDTIINVFNVCTYFYCYDPYTCYDNIALLCGCISIIYPLENMNKLDWLKTKGMFQVFLNKKDNISGIAYGNSEKELEYAQETIHNAPIEKLNAIEYGTSTIKNSFNIMKEYFFNKDPEKHYVTVNKLFYSNDCLSS